MAKEAGVGGAPLFVHVGLPSTPPPPGFAAAQQIEYYYDHPMSKLARGLLEAKVVALPSSAAGNLVTRTITLPHGVSWPDMHSPVLFVRHFYDNLWGKVLNTCKPKRGMYDAVIMGTPGIAKSSFGLYALYRAVNAGRTVIYSASRGGCAIFKGGKAYHFRDGSMYSLPEMSDPEALYISDGFPPVARSRAFRLLITHPERACWKSFVKSPGVREFALPNFTLSEMLQLRDVAFSDEPHCRVEEVVKRFNRWGGSARSVLTYSSESCEERLMLNSQYLLPLSVVEEAIRGTNVMDGIDGTDYVQRLFGIVPRGALPDNTLSTNDPLYYRFHYGQLITDHVLGLFADALYKRDKAEMFRFLRRATSNPATATLHRKVYELCIVVPRLVHGPGKGQSGDLQLKRLSPPMTPAQPKWLEAPCLSFAHGLRRWNFHDLEQLARMWKEDSADAIFVPHSKEEFPIVDFVLRIGGQALLVRIGGQALLAYATESESHDIKLEKIPFWDALLQAVGLADASKEIPFAWILNEPTFERFDDACQVKSQSGGSLATGIIARHHIGSRLAQYKLKLEASTVIV